MRITITITPQELRILEHIRESEGYFKLPQVVHGCIRGYYQKQYSNKQYMIKNKKGLVDLTEPDMTVEQYCESKGGEIITNNNNLKVCRVLQFKNDRGESFITIPLNMTDLRNYFEE